MIFAAEYAIIQAQTTAQGDNIVMTRPTAIVYVSNTGRTARYARMIGEKTGLPVYELTEAKKSLPKKTPVIYCGWLIASHVKDYKKAARRYTVTALCGVGLCPTGELLAEVRKATGLPAETPLFTLQGGMDRGALTGMYASMINMLERVMTKKKNPTEEDKAMVAMLREGGDFVNEENLSAFLAWYNAE